jgi:hypothetical protein
MRYNTELYQLYKLPYIIGAIKFARSRYKGHVHRMRGAECIEELWNVSLREEVSDDTNYGEWVVW